MFNIEWMKTVTREQFIEHEKHNAAYVPNGDLGAFYDTVIGKKAAAKAEAKPEVAKEAAPEPEPAEKNPSAEGGL